MAHECERGYDVCDCGRKEKAMTMTDEERERAVRQLLREGDTEAVRLLIVEDVRAILRIIDKLRADQIEEE